MFCPAFSPHEKRSELKVRADKDDVSQQLRTTNTTAEPIRKVSEGDTAKNLRLPEKAVNSLSPGAQRRHPPAKDKLSGRVPTDRLPRRSGCGSFRWAPLGLQEVGGQAFGLGRRSFLLRMENTVHLREMTMPTGMTNRARMCGGEGDRRSSHWGAVYLNFRKSIIILRPLPPHSSPFSESKCIAL